MAYQVAKAIGAYTAALSGHVDAIVLTGGASHSKRFVDYISKRVGWIAPIFVYAGDFEMEALAEGALRALLKTEEVKRFVPASGFDATALGGIAEE